MGIWSILQGPFVDVLLGSALAYTGLSFLGEYRKLLMSEPKTVMSIEVLMLAVTRAGGPGYIAALLLAGAVLCFLLAFITLAFNLSSYFGLLA